MARVRGKAVLTDDQKIRIALERFEPMANGMAPADYGDLAQRNDTSVKTIQRAIIEAFANGWVEIRPVRPYYSRMTELEERLEQKFSGEGRLETAIVVKHEEHGQDFAHQCLGSALADVIIAEWKFRNRDWIALGTGRGVHFVAEALLERRKQLSSREHIELVSLTGRIYPTVTKPVSKRTFSDNLADADTNISMMGRVFDSVAGLHPVVHQIAAEAGASERVLAESHLAKEQFDRHIPNHGIVGFGVLDGDHRLSREVSVKLYDKREPSGDEPAPPDLSGVRHSVQELVRLSEQYKREAGLPPPVGDICNRFFLIRPKVVKNLKVAGLLDELRDHVDALKSCLITVRKRELGEIPNLMVLGGGVEKAHILHYLLSGTTPAMPHIVVTDEKCAEAVLAIKGKRDELYDITSPT